MTPEHMYVRTEDIVRGNLWQRFPVINVDAVKDIPMDYPGLMGVPITFMDKYNSQQFRIYGVTNHVRMEDGREPYRRILIRNLNPMLPEVIDLTEWFRLMGVPIDVEMISDTCKGNEFVPAYRRLP